MNVLIIVAVVGLKFLLPVLYLRFPFAAGWANWLLDSVDGDLLIPAGLADPHYQILDKAADWVAYLFMFLWGWRQPIRREITAAFLLRSIGQASFFLTRNEIVFFAFPNLLEPLFLVYASLLRFKGAPAARAIYSRRWVLIWILILLYKFQDEYFTHVANVDRTEFLQGLLS